MGKEKAKSKGMEEVTLDHDPVRWVDILESLQGDINCEDCGEKLHSMNVVPLIDGLICWDCLQKKQVKKKEHKISVRFIFAWYDLWIGAFWDKRKRKLYILPVPCCGLVISFKEQQ